MTAALETSRIWEEISSPAARGLAQAALGCFAERGFHGTSTRDIATAAGLSPAAVYVHYRSKGELLCEISRIGHADAVRVLEEAAGTDGDPDVRLRRLVDDFARWHAENHDIARVVQYELDALPPERRSTIYALRRRCEEIVEGVLREGRAAGVLDLPDDAGAVGAAMLSLCVDIARWYHPGSRGFSPERIGSLYADLAMRMVGAGPAAGGAAGV